MLSNMLLCIASTATTLMCKSLSLAKLINVVPQMIISHSEGHMQKVLSSKHTLITKYSILDIKTMITVWKQKKQNRTKQNQNGMATKYYWSSFLIFALKRMTQIV